MIRQAIGVLVLIAALSVGMGAAANSVYGKRQVKSVSEVVRSVIDGPADKIDFAKAEMTFEKQVDPSINLEIMLGQIARMAASVRMMAGPNASSDEKLVALRRYVYQPGPWNDFKPYNYDFTDLYGRDYTHAQVSRYLTTRHGNCVSMPFLFIMLADRLGLRVTASMATRHIFVKYTGDDGKTINLETTSGANPARDVWILHEIPMSERTIATGAYMAPLTRKETLAAMAAVISGSRLCQRQV